MSSERLGTEGVGVAYTEDGIFPWSRLLQLLFGNLCGDPELSRVQASSWILVRSSIVLHLPSK